MCCLIYYNKTNKSQGRLKYTDFTHFTLMEEVEIFKAIQSLKEKNILIVDERPEGRFYNINIDYKTWKDWSAITTKRKQWMLPNKKKIMKDFTKLIFNIRRIKYG